jgi:serine/threonine-protein kinase
VLALGAGFVAVMLLSSAWYLGTPRTRVAAVVAPDSLPSLAVLPFENLGAAGDAYFADGMTEEISSRLGTLSGLRVIGRQSAKSYAGTGKPVAQIGKELGVAYLLTGTVRWDRSRAGRELVRVSPALLRASDGAQLWSEPYQDEVTGVFEIQGQVAERVARALQLRLTETQQKALASAPTTNVRAYDYYLRGAALEAGSWDPAEWARMIADYEQAVALDTGFALAHAALARAHLGVYWFRGDPSPRRLNLAKGALDRALALEPKLPAAHLALADYYYHGKLDYPRALDAIRTAQGLARNDPEALRLKGLIERRQGRWDDAIADFERTVELDPRNTAALADLCETRASTRRYEDARDACERFNMLAPTKSIGHYFLSRSAIHRSGEVKEALLILENARRQIGDEQLVNGLLSPESRAVWPGVLQPDLARRMASLAVPAEGPQRTGYLTSKLLLAVYQKDASAIRRYADAIVRAVPPTLRGNFFDSELHAELSLAYAAKGDRSRALAEGRRAMEIVPLHRDAVRGASNLMIGARAAVLASAMTLAIARGAAPRATAR